MKLRNYIRAILATLCICCGCNSADISRSAEDFDNITYSPRYATGFSISEDDSGNRLLRVKRPWQGDSNTEQT